MSSDRAKRMMAAFVRQGRAEKIVYRRSPVGETTFEPRQIDALVDRGPSEQVGQTQAPRFRIDVLNDADGGIAATTVDRGADLIDVAEMVGGELKARGIQAISGQDADWLTIDVV